MSAACVRTVELPVDKPVPVAVKVTAPLPPSDLLVCAERPIGLPQDPGIVAQIPASVRDAIIRIARAFRANADRLDRLIDWSRPATCRPEK